MKASIIVSFLLAFFLLRLPNELDLEDEKVRVLARGDVWYYDEILVTSDEATNVIDFMLV